MSGNKAAFHLADLFHTTALELGRAADGKAAYDAVLSEPEEKAAGRTSSAGFNGTGGNRGHATGRPVMFA